MAPPAKSTDGRRKSSTSKPGMLVTLKVSSDKLRDLAVDDDAPPVKEEASGSDTKEAVDSPAAPADAPANLAAPTNSNPENASDSNAATPAPETNGDGTPAPSTPMGPPAEGPKKKGTKRSAANGIDGVPKPRGKPGPKKKPRLEDGTIDHSGAAKGAGAHKLGPKANQGAINAGLRALDRSGKPCRKWQKGGFTLKSFTGVVWEVHRWTAPPKKGPESGTEDSAVPSTTDSSKENKENAPEGNSASNSNSGNDVEMQSAPSINASSPAPMAVAAAS